MGRNRGRSTAVFQPSSWSVVPSQEPNIVIVGGPNGAGKSTTAPAILRDTLGIDEFVNADVIALGISGFRPGGSAIAAGRIMLERMHELAGRRIDFAFETTLASRSFAPWLRSLASSGYVVHLIFLWLPSRSSLSGAFGSGS